MLYCIDRRFVDHICKIGSYCSGSCKCNLFQIYGFVHPHILGMYLQDIDPSFQVRLFYNDPAVKPSRS